MLGRRVRPLPFVWPHGVAFWLVLLWVYVPEFRIVRNARQAAERPDSPDAGSVRWIMLGMSVASLVAFPLAWVALLRLPESWQLGAFLAGIALLAAGSLLRRHCWKQLGASFTGDVRARPDQHIVTTGAYRLLRHPSYTGGIMMNAGIGVALGSWGSAVVLVAAAFVVYSYRIAVEERALLAAVGEPYREFLRSRKRLIPFLY